MDGKVKPKQEMTFNLQNVRDLVRHRVTPRCPGWRMAPVTHRGRKCPRSGGESPG